MRRVGLIVCLVFGGMMNSAVVSAENLVLQFFGTGAANVLTDEAEDRVWDLVDANNIDLSEFNCFEVEIRNPNTGNNIGIGVDCLRIDDIEENADYIELSAHSFFLMSGNNSFVSSGTTTVRAFRPGVGQGDRGDGQGPISHMTGSLPDDNNVAGGTGRFANVPGMVRLSGAVDLSDFDNDNIFFNCIFIAHLEPKENTRGPRGRQ